MIATMTSTHNFQQYNLASTSKVVFEKHFSRASTAAAPKSSSHVDTIPYNKKQANTMPTIMSILPCTRFFFALTAMLITGKLKNIKEKYHVDPQVLITGHHRSVRECIDCGTGWRSTVVDTQEKFYGEARLPCSKKCAVKVSEAQEHCTAHWRA